MVDLLVVWTADRALPVLHNLERIADAVLLSRPSGVVHAGFSS
jgi:hypothetical protein